MFYDQDDPHPTYLVATYRIGKCRYRLVEVAETFLIERFGAPELLRGEGWSVERWTTEPLMAIVWWSELFGVVLGAE